MSGSVLVTGMAWDTALGDGLEQVWHRLLAGETGIRVVPTDVPLRNERAAVPPDRAGPAGDPAGHQLALTRATMLRALAGAGIAAGDPRLRAVLGTSYGSHLDVPESDLYRWATALARTLGLRHPPVSVATACSAGSDSVLVGAELIAAGAAEVCVCGATDVLTRAKRLGHSSLRTMSPTFLRAFDAGHDGTLLGEGSGFLVLEAERSAARRGARPYGRIAGTGSANDATGSAAPDVTGRSIVLAVRRALADAGRTVADVTTINAHGSGTPVNDAAEARGYQELFAGVTRPPTLFATKGALGHTLGATGAIEVITLLLALRDGRVPPVLGLRTPMADFPLPLARAEAGRIGGTTGISVTAAFGGFTTCLVVEPPP
ncbi:beta-ketoacyl-[acyl-carrier-protein] synthase family protein [Symbioplanes lichenis]|uniref:beta-ketoacyl-[acyl-carrier-protein] synthase family protein n=1 Tax=Symbioplanes lichenis TaxID=1629072 RepID=UPI00273A4E91|nr:beta-ketoacyl-[acyl-carrier-protein] synthase family protein [Actinoplanes lichenis]